MAMKGYARDADRGLMNNRHLQLHPSIAPRLRLQTPGCGCLDCEPCVSTHWLCDTLRASVSQLLHGAIIGATSGRS